MPAPPVQAATARAAATTRTEDRCRFTLDGIVFVISEVVSACAGENVMAGNSDIFRLHGYDQVRRDRHSLRRCREMDLAGLL
jgi:hypothetical protein